MRILKPALVEPLVLGLLAPIGLFATPHRFILLLAIPVVWIWQCSRTGHFIARSPLDWVLLLMLVMLGVSTLVTYNLALGVPAIAGVIYGLGLYYGIARIVQGPRMWLICGGLFLLGGAGTILGPVAGAFFVELLQTFTWSKFLNWHTGAMGAIIILVVMLAPKGFRDALRRMPTLASCWARVWPRAGNA